MNGGPATEVTEPAETIATASTSIALATAATANTRPRRLPVRLYLLSHRTTSGRLESEIYRQLPAALRHAERLTDQGFAASVSMCSVQSWSTSTYLPLLTILGSQGAAR